MGKRTWTPVLGVTVVLAIGLTACGGGRLRNGNGNGSGEGDAGGPATTSAAVAAVKPGVDPVGEAVPGTITVDGRDRTYRVYVPSTLPPGQPAPLLVGLHGGTGWGAQFEKNSQFDRLAEANGFLVVYPDGVGTGADASTNRTWNGGNCCGVAVREQVDDVAFITQLVQKLSAEYAVDPTRIYATGHSNGAIMSYRLACERADVFAAAAVYAGTLGVRRCDPSEPVSFMHVHGTADESLPIDGGIGRRSIAGVAFPPPHDGIVTMATANGCPTDPTTTTEGALTTESWSPCARGTAVEFVTIDGASHAWPGGPQSAGAQALVGVAYQGYDASAELWAFLATHPKQ